MATLFGPAPERAANSNEATGRSIQQPHQNPVTVAGARLGALQQLDGCAQVVHVDELAQRWPVPARGGLGTHGPPAGGAVAQQTHSRFRRLGRLERDQCAAVVTPSGRGVSRPVKASVEAVTVGWASRVEGTASSSTAGARHAAQGLLPDAAVKHPGPCWPSSGRCTTARPLHDALICRDQRAGSWPRRDGCSRGLGQPVRSGGVGKPPTARS